MCSWLCFYWLDRYLSHGTACLVDSGKPQTRSIVRRSQRASPSRCHRRWRPEPWFPLPDLNFDKAALFDQGATIILARSTSCCFTILKLLREYSHCEMTPQYPGRIGYVVIGPIIKAGNFRMRKKRNNTNTVSSVNLLSNQVVGGFNHIICNSCLSAVGALDRLSLTFTITGSEYSNCFYTNSDALSVGNQIRERQVSYL